MSREAAVRILNAKETSSFHDKQKNEKAKKNALADSDEEEEGKEAAVDSGNILSSIQSIANILIG